MRPEDALPEDLQEALLRLRAGLASAISEVRVRLGELEYRAARLRQQTQAAAAEFARDNPWTIVALGAALGLLMGAAAASRKRR